MEPRRIALLAAALLLAAGGVLALVALQWRHDLGGFAESPQLLALEVREKVVAGGGRAVVGLAAASSDGASLRVRCRDVETPLELVPGAVSDEICGLRLELVAVEPTVSGSRAVVRARW